MRSNIHERLQALASCPVLAGQRIRLRPPRSDDVDDVYAIYSDPRMPAFELATMRSGMQAQGRIEEIQAAFQARDMLQWLIVERRSDRAVGSCALFGFDARARRAELGYALHPACWGQGLGSEAVALALAWGFRSLGLARVEASIDARNQASRRLLQRQGFACTRGDAAASGHDGGDPSWQAPPAREHWALSAPQAQGPGPARAAWQAPRDDGASTT